MRKEIITRIPNKDAPSVENALRTIFTLYQEEKNPIIKSITSDNGFEFSSLANLSEQKEVDIYFAHPYAFYERETNGRHNELIRKIHQEKAAHPFVHG